MNYNKNTNKQTLSKTLIIMFCCSDLQKQETQYITQWKEQFKLEKQGQPLKFKLLSLLGIKKYLINKYIFARQPPKYSIQEEDGVNYIKTQIDIQVPVGYRYTAKIIQDNPKEIQQKSKEDKKVYSIPSLILSLINRQEYKATLIYSHGNSSDLSDSFYFISKLAKKYPFFDYIIYDYTGYGVSKVDEISQESICDDLDRVIQEYKLKNQEIVLWGFSLGAYPTCRCAATRVGLRGVVLHSPLASVYNLFDSELQQEFQSNSSQRPKQLNFNEITLNKKLIKNDNFNLLEYLPKIQKTLLLILHSKHDQIIPISHSKLLFSTYKHTNPNPFCFFMQVTHLKHNHLHAMIIDQKSNEINQEILLYFQIMVNGIDSVNKGRMLRAEKSRYFQDLGDVGQGVRVNLDPSIKDNSVLDSKNGQQMQRNSNVYQLQQENHFYDVLKKMKEDHMFEFDDIQQEERVDLNHYLQIKTDQHRNYFIQTIRQEQKSLLKSKSVISDNKKKKDLTLSINQRESVNDDGGVDNNQHVQVVVQRMNYKDISSYRQSQNRSFQEQEHNFQDNQDVSVEKSIIHQPWS